MTGRPDLRPVLLCYDGSESSVRAIEAAGALSIGGAALVCHAWAGLSRVMLRGSYDLLPAPLAEAVDELDELDRQAADRVADEGVQVARRAGFEAQPLPL
ncbi:MAG TPA: hypothetical protein VFQ12_02645, partial [Thermoleophilaceae bacterium]|nr:hypothetical protein [Thermoleophilaceae bacterium]